MGAGCCGAEPPVGACWGEEALGARALWGGGAVGAGRCGAHGHCGVEALWARGHCGVEVLWARRRRGRGALWGAWALCGACGRVGACCRGSEVHAARSMFQVLVGLKQLLTEGLMTPRVEAAVQWEERGSESDTLALGTSRIPLVWAACV